MEELVKQLQASAQIIEGVSMVPLDLAVQSVHTASAVGLLDQLDTKLADTYRAIQQFSQSVE